MFWTLIHTYILSSKDFYIIYLDITPQQRNTVLPEPFKQIKHLNAFNRAAIPDVQDAYISDASQPLGSFHGFFFLEFSLYLHLQVRIIDMFMWFLQRTDSAISETMY